MKIKELHLIEHPFFGTTEKIAFTKPDGTPLDTIVLTGINGSGKTTLLHVIHNLLQHGTIFHEKNCQGLTDFDRFEYIYLAFSSLEYQTITPFNDGKTIEQGLKSEYFRKSLLVSTLKCLFQGRKELFEGLWIADQSEWDWKEHALIALDFNEIPGSTPEELKQGVSFRLKKIAQEYELSLEAPFIELQFQELILALAEKTGMLVVVLIDEYDKRIIDHLGKGTKGMEIAKANRDILKSFFGVLKGGSVSPILRFVFLTGISRFSRVSIFSELNNLIDISMDDEYAGLLGYTQQELETCFHEYIAHFAAALAWSPEQITAKLAQHYNGYRFAECDIQVQHRKAKSGRVEGG